MGDPRKHRKKFEGPRHPWQLDQLEAELTLVGEYGLRNKRELWRLRTMISKIRGIARSLQGTSENKSDEQHQVHRQMLIRFGLLREDASIDEVLDLNIRNLLERRLQTIVYKKGLSKTIHQARQMITHGHIKIQDRRVTVPGYLVKRNEENFIEYSHNSSYRSPKHPALIQTRGESQNNT